MKKITEELITEIAERCEEIVKDKGKQPVKIKRANGNADIVWFLDFHNDAILSICDDRPEEIERVFNDNPDWIDSDEVVAQALKEYFDE